VGDAVLPGNSVRGLLALALALHAFGGELALEGAVEELSALSCLDSKRSVESGGSADVNGLAIGDTAAAKRVLVEKVALFPRELNAAASLLDKERVVMLGQTPDELSGHVSHSWIFAVIASNFHALERIVPLRRQLNYPFSA